jgi:UDP-N-acetylmuramoyl-tripeptide--D-alanyl-D-alanine ligase
MIGAQVKQWVRRFRTETVRPIRIRLAARARAGAKGVFIGVTGSSGKSTTTAMIAAIMAAKGGVTSQILHNTINPLIRTMRASAGSDHVVVEAGIGEKGLMKIMASLLRPDVAVVTMVGLEHYSIFRSAEAIAAEKGELVEAVHPEGLVVLNADDPLVMGMAARSRARIVTFGFGETADCRIVDVAGGLPDGVTVRLQWRGETLDIPTNHAGKHFAVLVAAAVAVGLELGVKPADVLKAVVSCHPLPLRMSIHRIEGGPVMVADSAKAPLGTLQLAFEALQGAAAPRKRIVLGSLSDYKITRKNAYRMAFEHALAVADEVIVVSDIDQPERYAKSQDDKNRLTCFNDMRAASGYIARTAIPDEVILLKGSSNFHLERILIDMAGKVNCWKLACGRQESCYQCGLFEFDHESHDALRRRRLWSTRSGARAQPGLTELQGFAKSGGK